MPERRASAPASRSAARGTEYHWAESAARSHLESRGYAHLASNYRLRRAELDLVMLEGDTVVVVEVKQRKNDRYGHPAEAIDARKLSRLLLAARHFVAFELRRPDARLRLDAVTLLGVEGDYRLEHLRDVGGLL